MAGKKTYIPEELADEIQRIKIQFSAPTNSQAARIMLQQLKINQDIETIMLRMKKQVDKMTRNNNGGEKP